MSSMSGGPTAETIALFAGLYQWHDFLDESHVQSQSIEGQGQLRLGDYWHAIMHRREPDYANSRYWFRQVGRQPIFKELATCADRILQEHTRAGRPGDAERWRSLLMRGDTWNPAAFVDLCEACHGRDDPLTFAARRIQQAEMALLMQATIAAAI